MSLEPRKPWPPKRKLRLFTFEHADFVKEAYWSHHESEIAELVNAKFGTAYTTKQVIHLIKNRGFRSGRNGQFARGRPSWNAGTKGQGLSKANSGSFKKGVVPKHTKPVGSERIDNKDGYLYVKVSDNPHRWRQRHHVLWEQHHGPIPPGHNVQFIDGDRMNIVIENLELISRGVNARRNKMGYSQFEPEIKPAITAIAKVEQAAHERRKEANGKQNK